MIESIAGARDMRAITELSPNKASGGNEPVFQSLINELIDSENANNLSSREMMEGNIDNLITAMVDMAEADLTLKYTMQVRNKIVEAYQEIMRMQV